MNVFKFILHNKNISLKLYIILLIFIKYFKSMKIIYSNGF